MKFRIRGWKAIGLGLSLCLMTVSLLAVANAEEAFSIKAVADKTLKELPSGPLYWRLETFPALQQAKAAEGPASLSAEVSGKVWLFTLGPPGGSTPGGTKVAEVGPVPPITAPAYLLRITHSGGPPGAKTPVHSHPGAETIYVLSGRMGQTTPHGTTFTEAGQFMNGQHADMAMAVFSAGTTDLDQLVMFVLDATRPFTTAASLQ